MAIDLGGRGHYSLSVRRFLDTLIPRLYKSRPFTVGVLALALGLAPARGWASAVAVHGLVLPSGSQQVGENRYRSPFGYEETLKYFATNYKTNSRKPVVNQPGIRAVHIESVDPKTKWEGFNVYEEQGKEVRIFVIARERAAKTQHPK